MTIAPAQPKLCAMPSENLIGMERLTELIETVIWTGTLTNSVPISILLVGPPGAGKSKSLVQFEGPSIHATNDITTAGLFDIMQRDRESLIRHILLPDMNAVLSHKASTTNLFFGNLLALMSEGIVRIDDGRQQKEIPHLPVGLITAATTRMYEENVRQWEKTGLKRRFVPVFYTYTMTTRMKINEAIRNGNVTLKQMPKKKVALPKKQCTISIASAEAQAIEGLALMMAQNLSFQPQWVNNGREDKKIFVKPAPGEPALEFTPHLVLRSLAMARARKQNRSYVAKDDVSFLASTIDFCRYGAPVQL